MLTNWIKNSLVVLVATVITVAVFELALGVVGLYDEQVGISLKPSNTIWTRYPDSTGQQKHPDLAYPISLKYDEFGSRNLSGVSPRELSDIVGFFGDSFTENRRVEERYSLTAMLNEIWGEKRAVNFGVDGFGLEQSYQRYLNLSKKLNMSDVVYVFCRNDLRNLYEVGLFRVGVHEDQSAKLELVNESGSASLKSRIRRALGRLRITYLFLDAYQTARGRTALPAGQVQELADKYADNPSLKGHGERFHDQFADSIAADFVSAAPSLETIELAKKFMLILNQWRQQVESSGANFHIAVLPFSLDKAVFERLLSSSEESPYNTVSLDLPATFKETERYAARFRHDAHWNEIGNLAAVPGMATHLGRFGLPAKDGGLLNPFLAQKVQEIERYYQSRDGKPYQGLQR